MKNLENEFGRIRFFFASMLWIHLSHITIGHVRMLNMYSIDEWREKSLEFQNEIKSVEQNEKQRCNCFRM